MSRVLIDDALDQWIVFASTAHGGLPAPGRIVFQPRPAGQAPARAVEIEGTQADAEARVVNASEEELRRFLERAVPVR